MVALDYRIFCMRNEPERLKPCLRRRLQQDSPKAPPPGTPGAPPLGLRRPRGACLARSPRLTVFDWSRQPTGRLIKLTTISRKSSQFTALLLAVVGLPFFTVEEACKRGRLDRERSSRVQFATWPSSGQIFEMCWTLFRTLFTQP